MQVLLVSIHYDSHFLNLKKNTFQFGIYDELSTKK